MDRKNKSLPHQMFIGNNSSFEMVSEEISVILKNTNDDICIIDNNGKYNDIINKYNGIIIKAQDFGFNFLDKTLFTEFGDYYDNAINILSSIYDFSYEELHILNQMIIESYTNNYSAYEFYNRLGKYKKLNKLYDIFSNIINYYPDILFNKKIDNRIILFDFSDIDKNVEGETSIKNIYKSIFYRLAINFIYSKMRYNYSLQKYTWAYFYEADLYSNKKYFKRFWIRARMLSGILFIKIDSITKDNICFIQHILVNCAIITLANLDEDTLNLCKNWLSLSNDELERVQKNEIMNIE